MRGTGVVQDSLKASEMERSLSFRGVKIHVSLVYPRVRVQ